MVREAIAQAGDAARGFGKRTMGALHGAWDAAGVPNGQGGMYQGAVDGWNEAGPQVSKGVLPPPEVTSSPSGDALRATEPVPPAASEPASVRSAPVTPGGTNFTAGPPGPNGEPSVVSPAEELPPRAASAGAPPIPPEPAGGGGTGGTPPGGGAPPEGPGNWWDRAKGRMAAQAGVETKGLKSGVKIGMSGLEGIGGAAKWIGKKVPGVAQAYEVADSASKAFSPEGDAEPMWKHGLRLGARMAGIGGGAALGAIPGAALGPAGAIGGGVLGAGLGYEAMDKLGNMAFGPEPGKGIADRFKEAGMRATAKPAPAPSGTDSGSVGKTGVGGGDPNATGGFTRTGDDMADYHRANAYLQLRGLDPNRMTAPPGGMGGGGGDENMHEALNGLRTGIGSRGPMGAMAALMIGGNLHRMKYNAAGMQLRGAQIQATNDLAHSQMALAQYNKDRDYNTGREDLNAKNNDAALEDYVKASIPGQNTSIIGGEKPADYANRVGTEKSKLADRIHYTLGDTDGKRIGQLDGPHLQQLLMGDKFRAKLEASRGDLINRMHDFTGNKRFDSRNLYSYIPSGAEPTMLPNSGGYRVQMKNGNTMTVYNARNGGFNFTSPSDAVDADAEQFIAPFIKQQREQGK